mmetsp:Transcript_12640/g.32973  ORF Transcript_12640/g.32973 Transcript_12640/m.32973 type:complete len:274 (+) Transcript_12640:245-1066(+)
MGRVAHPPGCETRTTRPLPPPLAPGRGQGRSAQWRSALHRTHTRRCCTAPPGSCRPRAPRSTTAGRAGPGRGSGRRCGRIRCQCRLFDRSDLQATARTAVRSRSHSPCRGNRARPRGACRLAARPRPRHLPQSRPTARTRLRTRWQTRRAAAPRAARSGRRPPRSTARWRRCPPRRGAGARWSARSCAWCAPHGRTAARRSARSSRRGRGASSSSQLASRRWSRSSTPPCMMVKAEARARARWTATVTAAAVLAMAMATAMASHCAAAVAPVA